MKKICVYIPSYNRSDSIRYYLERLVQKFFDFGIDICIGDSSTDELTRRTVDEYINKGCTNVLYLRGTEIPQDIKQIIETKYDGAAAAPCYKVYEHERILAEKYDYIWLCGDGILIKPENIISELLQYSEQGVDIIHFTDMGELGYSEDRIYTNPLELYKNEVFHLMLYGASVISKKVIEGISGRDMLMKYGGQVFSM